MLLGIWVLIGCVTVSRQAWTDYGGGRPKPELYGICSVTEFTVGGNPAPPLTTDEKRWQRIVFDDPGILTYQRMDGELVPVPAELHSDTIRYRRCAPRCASTGPIRTGCGSSGNSTANP